MAVAARRCTASRGRGAVDDALGAAATTMAAEAGRAAPRCASSRSWQLKELLKPPQEQQQQQQQQRARSQDETALRRGDGDAADVPGYEPSRGPPRRRHWLNERRPRDGSAMLLPSWASHLTSTEEQDGLRQRTANPQRSCDVTGTDASGERKRKPFSLRAYLTDCHERTATVCRTAVENRPSASALAASAAAAAISVAEQHPGVATEVSVAHFISVRAAESRPWGDSNLPDVAAPATRCRAVEAFNYGCSTYTKESSRSCCGLLYNSDRERAFLPEVYRHSSGRPPGSTLQRAPLTSISSEGHFRMHEQRRRPSAGEARAAHTALALAPRTPVSPAHTRQVLEGVLPRRRHRVRRRGFARLFPCFM